MPISVAMMTVATPPKIVHRVGSRERLLLHGVALCQQIALNPVDFVHFVADAVHCGFCRR